MSRPSAISAPSSRIISASSRPIRSAASACRAGRCRPMRSSSSGRIPCMPKRGGWFKGRGAFHKLLASQVPAAGIIAASGGNHGVAAAYAARALGHKAEIFVPTIASPSKVARLKSYGAVVHQVGAVYAEARAASEKRAAATGALIVPAYEDEVVFAGAGSAALEFAEQAKFDTLLVAVGGGGLIAGCASAIGEGTRIVAVETEGTPTLHEALRAGHPVGVRISCIAADALGASLIGTPNFEVARKLVAESVLVSDDAVRKAQRALWDELRVAADPPGAP